MHLMGNDGIVALVPVRPVELLGPVDFYPVLESVAVSDMTVNDKLGRIVPDDIKVGGEEVGKKTAPTCV